MSDAGRTVGAIRMPYLLIILAGTVLGLLLQRKTRLLRPVPALTLWLLLAVIFLMGAEMDLRALSPGLLAQALGLCVASIVGSVLCLSLVRFLLRR